MPRNRVGRTLVELLHIAAGVAATGLIATLAAWSVPNARDAIWWVAWGAAAVVIYWGIRPLQAAWTADRRGAPDGVPDGAPDWTPDGALDGEATPDG